MGTELPKASWSSDPSRNVGFRAGVFRVREDLSGFSIFHQIAEMEEGRLLADSSRLLHRVRDNYYRVVPPQLVDQIFDLRRRYGIKR